MIPVSHQWQIFLSLIAVGMFIGFAFDCYRVGRFFWRPGKVGTYTGDSLFWFIFTPLTFLMLFLINWGEVRAYVFLAIIAGAGIYAGIFSRWVRRGLYAVGHIFLKIISLFRRFIGHTIFLIFIPGRWVLKNIWHKGHKKDF